MYSDISFDYLFDFMVELSLLIRQFGWNLDFYNYDLATFIVAV